MASRDTRSGVIIKSGFLSTSKVWKNPKLPFSLRPKPKYCDLWEQDDGIAIDSYNDETKTKLKETVNFTDNEEVKVEKHNHDDFLCISKGKQVTFLRATSRQERDDWYTAIRNSLYRLGVAGTHHNIECDAMRPRADTSPGTDSAVINRYRKTQPVSSPSGTLVGSFTDELVKVVTNTSRPPRKCAEPVPPPINSDIFCCPRNHVVSLSPWGTNMADESIVYENIHFIRSKEEWEAGVESRKDSIRYTKELYSDLPFVMDLQAPHQEPVYETSIQGREPEEHDERNVGLRSTSDFNNLDRDTTPRHEQELNLNVEGSIEDNNAADNRPTKPPVPAPRMRQGNARIRFMTEQIKADQRQPNGISKHLPKRVLVGDKNKIELMEMKDGIWVIGWDQDETELGRALKVGDQLIKINKQALTSASFARDTIRSTDEDKVTLVLKRIPHGTVCTIKRKSQRDDIGITLDRNEIISIDVNGLAARVGGLKPQATGVSGRLCNWAITEINTHHVDPFASADDIMKQIRRSTEDLTLIVQPVDFIQMIRDQLKRESGDTSLTSF